MLELDDIRAWLLELGQIEAAALLDEAEIEYEFIDTVFRMDSSADYGTDIYEASIRLPARTYRLLKTDHKAKAEQVESAIAELAGHTPGSYIRRTGWVLRIPKLSEVQALPLISECESAIDAPGVRRLWGKAKIRLVSDPDGAITASRTLLESVLKHCLDRDGGSYSNTDDLPALFKKAAAKLEIAPNASTYEEYKRMAAACATIVSAIAAVRNREGDSHVTASIVSRWHAQLVVNLAGTMADFLISLPSRPIS